MTCQTCDGTERVCENHRDRPWDGGSGRDDACGCGPGVPCPECVAPPDARLCILADHYRDRAARVLEAVDTQYEQWALTHGYHPENIDAMRKWVGLRQEWEAARPDATSGSLSPQSP